MSLPLVINGVTYNYPQVDDVDWGPDATDWASAVTTGMLQKAGGLFQLLAEVDFGTAYGVKALYLKSRTANPATVGFARLARADVLSWRNQANDGDLSLGVNSSDVLTFDGNPIQGGISVSDTSTIDLTFSADTLSADIVALSIDNSFIANAAAIAFSKLASLSSGNILVGSAGNVATSVAMSGDVTIDNTGATAIGANKILNSMLAQMPTMTIKGNNTGGSANADDLTGTEATAILDNFVGDSGAGGTKGLVPAPAPGDLATKFLNSDGSWKVPSGAGDVVGPASSTNNGFARFDGTDGKLLKDSPATISNADVASNAAIAFSKLATLTSAHILVGSAGNVATDVAVTGDISITNAGVTAYAGTVPLNKGGTGQTTKAPAFDALSPMTTGGDLIYGGASGTGTALPNGSSGQFLKSNGGTAAPSWSGPSGLLLSQGLQTVFTSGGTFTTPSNSSTSTIYEYFIVGAGGGGGGATASGGSGVGGGGGAGAVAIGTFTGVAASTGITVTVGSGGAVGSSSGGTGTTGGTSSLGSPVSVTCTGGVGGVGSTTAGSTAVLGGVGGTITVGTPSVAIPGGQGKSGALLSATILIAGSGADGPFGCGGSGALGCGANLAGSAGAGFGAGGGGAQGASAGGAGSGGLVIITQLTP